MTADRKSQAFIDKVLYLKEGREMELGRELTDIEKGDIWWSVQKELERDSKIQEELNDTR